MTDLTNTRLRAWVTGAGGLIGHWLCQTSPVSAPAYAVIPLTRQNLDLTDFDAVRRRFQEERPDLVIHCAALSRSPECQANPALARRLNIEVTRLLAELAEDRSLVFFSTDLVFDGHKGNYEEKDRVNPLSVYAETKVEAETFVLANPLHRVIRTSLNGGQSPTGDRGFNEQMRKAWEQGRSLKLFTDEFRSPISAQVTATATWALATGAPPGLYHLAGGERLSRWDIGRQLAERWPGLNPRIEPGSLREYQGAPRAPDTSLNSGKAQSHLPFALPAFSAWLRNQPDGTF